MGLSFRPYLCGSGLLGLTDLSRSAAEDNCTGGGGGFRPGRTGSDSTAPGRGFLEIPARLRGIFCIFGAFEAAKLLPLEGLTFCIVVPVAVC